MSEIRFPNLGNLKTNFLSIAENKIYFICVSNVQNMECMFMRCKEFNQSLNNWTVKMGYWKGNKSQYLRCIFYDCDKLKYYPDW